MHWGAAAQATCMQSQLTSCAAEHADDQVQSKTVLRTIGSWHTSSSTLQWLKVIMRQSLLAAAHLMAQDVACLHAWHEVEVQVQVRAADGRRGDFQNYILLQECWRLHTDPSTEK